MSTENVPTMFERVVKAIREADVIATAQDEPETPVDLIRLAADLCGRHHEAIAIAAISAMREPTEGMLEAAWEKVDYSIDDFWRAMVDAALPPPPSTDTVG